MRNGVDLPVASAHLHYEYSMLVFTAEQMQAFVEGGDKRTKDAYLESFCVHFRCLKNFFFCSHSPQKPDDMLAIDYFEVGAWERLRPHAIPKSFELRDQVNKEIVHLSYRRAEVQKHRWEFGQVVSDMRVILVAFLSNVDHRLLGPWGRSLIDLSQREISIHAATSTGTTLTGTQIIISQTSLEGTVAIPVGGGLRKA
jgi:hypothetical protein